MSICKFQNTTKTMDKFIKQDFPSINNTIVESDKIIKCLNKVLDKNKEHNTEDLLLYRLEALLRVISIKIIILRRLGNNDEEKIIKLENQLKAYIKDANSTIYEIVKTGIMPTKCCNNTDCEIDWD